MIGDGGVGPVVDEEVRVGYMRKWSVCGGCGVCVGGGTKDKTMIICRKAWSSKCPPPALYMHDELPDLVTNLFRVYS